MAAAQQRIHPAKPKVGIRASRPNEIWHVDTTLIRLLDGSRAYRHAVIDNFSRRILAWKATEEFAPGTTAQILVTASRGVDQAKPMLLTDGGVANYNAAVDELIARDGSRGAKGTGRGRIGAQTCSVCGTVAVKSN